MITCSSKIAAGNGCGRLASQPRRRWLASIGYGPDGVIARVTGGFRRARKGMAGSRLAGHTRRGRRAGVDSLRPLRRETSQNIVRVRRASSLAFP
jgi:hypothetical protein